MSKNYSVELNLGGNISQKLDEAISKAKQLKDVTSKISIRGGRGSAGVGRAGVNRRPMPFSQRQSSNILPYQNWAAFNRVLMSTTRLMGGFGNTVANISTGLQGFFQLTKSGSGEFGKTLSSLRKSPFGASIAGVMIPAAVGYGYYKAGKGLYDWGRSQLESQRTSEAISNMTQYEMARKGLGSEYEGIFQSAQTIAEKTGQSRAGLVSLMNTLTGLHVGKSELSSENAKWIADVTSKISAVSGRNMQVVGLNMQQLLTTWQGIDMKELFKSVPLIEKYVFQLREQDKQTSKDIYAFIRENPQRLMDALEMFASQMQIPDVAVSRGQLELSQENLDITKTKNLDTFYSDIARVGVNINKAWEDFYKAFGQNYDGSVIQNAIKTFESIMVAMINAFATITEWAEKHPHLFNQVLSLVGAGAGAVVGGPYGAAAGYLGTLGVSEYIHSTNKEGQQRRAFVQNFSHGKELDKEGLVSFPFRSDISKEDAERLGFTVNRISDDTASAPNSYNYNRKTLENIASLYQSLPDDDDWKKRYKFLFEEPSKKGVPASVWGTFGKGMTNSEELQRQYMFQSLVAEIAKRSEGTALGIKPDVSSTSADKSKVENITRGSKSLIINFNKEIVAMTNVMDAADPVNLADKIREYVEEAIPRGLHIAFNQATQIL